MSEIKIHFLGAAGTVTGSKYLIEAAGKKILVDCGLFQGIKKLRQLNWENLPVNASEIDCVLITHGHLDHCGFLPRLVDMGYKNRIYGTAPTLEIAEIILRDSAKIQEEDAERANKKGYSKHHPAKALYTVVEVDRTVGHFRAVEENYWMEDQVRDYISVTKDKLYEVKVTHHDLLAEHILVDEKTHSLNGVIDFSLRIADPARDFEFLDRYGDVFLKTVYKNYLPVDNFFDMRRKFYAGHIPVVNLYESIERKDKKMIKIYLVELKQYIKLSQES